ncbi:MAG: tRNA (adenosine(37)-N6)-dimethylallyltransferase MiaA [Phycisphaerales bacterium]|nr:tRNA (adenosine(37)-N6)-dimethylallyltransferase MiaA [Phycisphaerales bacterium]
MTLPPTLPLTRFPVIVGPTAGGKSALAVGIAHELRELHGIAGEIVTADSIQVYRGLDIGSAKPTVEEMEGIPHHLIDLREPTESFSVQQWLELAEKEIAEIRLRGAIPIMVGGTHLYVKAFMDGLFDGPGSDPLLRERLNAQPLETLREELDRVDPLAASRIHAADQRRTVRALEVFHATGTPISELQRQWDRHQERRTDCVLIGLEWPIEQINRRINARVKGMVERGLVEEARRLWEEGQLGVQAREALGYKQLIPVFEGKSSLEEAIERIKIETRRFGKNQRTWLKRLRQIPGSVWIDAVAVPQERRALLAIEACRGVAG